MTDTQAPSSTTPATASTTEQGRKARPRRKQQARRKARRRDGDDSDASDDERTESSAQPDKPAKPTTLTPLFPDAVSTTPTVWADSDPTEVDVVSFDDFNRGIAGNPTRGRRGGAASRGRGRGGKTLVGPSNATIQPSIPRDAAKGETDDAAEERAQLKKERQKAKRKDAKEKRRMAASNDKDDTSKTEREDAHPTPTDDSLVASTSALTLDGPAPSAPGNPTNRVQHTAEDPKFTPRVGNFWMHDQRHHESGHVGEGGFVGRPPMLDHWRGRGGHRGMVRGAFRGAPRGRGRGFAPFANMAGPPFASPSTMPPPRGGRMTEMDKLELEMANKERQKKLLSAADSGKWGHEGYEEQASTEDAFRNYRSLRGRGRVGRGLPRGSAPRPFVPAHLPTPEPSPERSAFKAVLKPSEGTTTQSAAESLLDDSGSVTVRLPGDVTTVEVPASVAEATAVATSTPPAPSSDTAPTRTSESPFPPPFTPSNPSPVPQVASDSGSISSGYVPSVPPVPMGGEFYPMQANFRPPAGGNMFPLNFPPQSFTPEPMHPHHHHHPSFSGAPGFFPAGRSNSPLNPYAAPLAYFVPPGPTQKVQIRSALDETVPKSPTSDVASNHSQGVEPYMPTYYYNPYNGMPLPDQGGVFYPPQGYWPGAYDGGDFHAGY